MYPNCVKYNGNFFLVFVYVLFFKQKKKKREKYKRCTSFLNIFCLLLCYSQLLYKVFFNFFIFFLFSCLNSLQSRIIHNYLISSIEKNKIEVRLLYSKCVFLFQSTHLIKVYSLSLLSKRNYLIDKSFVAEEISFLFRKKST